MADHSEIFEGPGEMRALCREFDWGATSLGPTTGWSRVHQNTVRMVLAARWPMLLYWGPELVQVFNDAFTPSLGAAGSSERALGTRAADYWAAAWPIVGAQIEAVMARGEASWYEDALVPVQRDGKLEDVYWTYGQNPVFDDDGIVVATLVICQDTTARIRAAEELARTRIELNEALEQLQNSHWHIRRNKEVLPICLGCGRVHEQGNKWTPMVDFIQSNSSFLSHGYCPGCLDKEMLALESDLAAEEPVA